MNFFIKWRIHDFIVCITNIFMISPLNQSYVFLLYHLSSQNFQSYMFEFLLPL